MEINEYLNKWLSIVELYYQGQSVSINNLNLVHEDFRGFVKSNGTQTIYNCTKIDDGYLFLKSKDFSLKVKPQAIKDILEPSSFSWEEPIGIINKDNLKAEIENIIWHAKDSEYKYTIKIDGKSKSKWYVKSDLSKLS